MRLRVELRGLVQGVGFRPFVYRVATEMGLPGFVQNSASGVCLEVEGPGAALDDFLVRLEQDKPPLVSYSSVRPSRMEAVGFTNFEIRPSDDSGPRHAHVLPDIATCPTCLEEVFDPGNRRYLYPFTNCTHCGPRYSIIERIPYDRPHTTMKVFPLCEACEAEYRDPTNRRFHAQPNACPACGPHLEAWDSAGRVLGSANDALRHAVKAIRHGEVVAVKGLGGFHLVVDATSDQAVRRLRLRKHRDEKPFALMYPGLALVRRDAMVSEVEEELLLSVHAPIVLLEKGPNPAVSTWVAPGNTCLGVMLPYTPLHHILLRELGSPIVATSGNLSDEPICTDEHEALERLGGIADFYLVHDRPIARHVDDSIVRVIDGEPMLLRRARGYAPLPLALREKGPPVLAVGGHLKNTVAVSNGSDVFVSQHIGDLETREAFYAFEKAVTDLQELHEVQPVIVAEDPHPAYASTRFARRSGLPCYPVQHHYAHVLGCMEEHALDDPVLGVAWDGTGYGLDGSIWGGEFLEATRWGFVRKARLRHFRLPGGEKAVVEPRRAALGLLGEMFGGGDTLPMDLLLAFDLDPLQRETMVGMIEKGTHAPLTSSVGRLFDVVASLLGLCQVSTFEGQAAMQLEAAVNGDLDAGAYSYRLEASAGESDAEWVVDWEPAIRALLEDLRAGVSRPTIATRFHNMLAGAIVGVARVASCHRVVLTGGCFQNRYLAEQSLRRLREAGFEPYTHRRIPPNDGGLSFGQVVAATYQRNGAKPCA